jgi:hypothetical protein
MDGVQPCRYPSIYFTDKLHSLHYYKILVSTPAHLSAFAHPQSHSRFPARASVLRQVLHL